jgi:hypothetical protein
MMTLRVMVVAMREPRNMRRPIAAERREMWESIEANPRRLSSRRQDAR